MSRWFFLLGILELLVSATVVAIFRLIEDRFLAGMVAGSLFIAVGLLIVGRGLAERTFRRSATFVIGCVHLLAIAMPMVVVRLLNRDVEFREIRIWGMPGPVFHGLSEMLYLILLIATFGEGLWRWQKGRKLIRPSTK